MTELLERAIAKLKTLPASEQDAIAAMILEELEDDRLSTRKRSHPSKTDSLQPH